MSADGFAPGVDISFGDGDNLAVCTAGWLIKVDNTVSLATAGHCAAEGGTSVSFKYVPEGKNVVLDAKSVPIGKVVSNSYAEPFNPDNTDIALIGLSQEFIDGGTPVIMNVGGKINAEPPLKDISGIKGNKVCWYSNASKLEMIGAMASCGTVVGVSADQSKVLVKPNDNVKFDAQMAGAPATVNNGKLGAAERNFALGVFTGVYKDYAVIDSLAKVTEGGGTILGVK